MNSISPQMLGLTAGKLTLVRTAGGPEGQAPTRTSASKRLLRMAARWRWVLIGSVLAGAVLGLLLTLLTPRQYAATARLQISRETAQVVNVGNVSRDASIGDQEFYQTQYGLLRAQALAERVARNLGVVDDPAFFRMFGKSDVFASNSGPAGRAKRNEIAGQILLKHVEVAPVHGSSLVDVEARTPSPALSQKIAQTWGQDFIASNLERRLDASGYARQFLETRLEQLRDKVESSERRAMEYAASQGIIELPSPGTSSSKSSTGDLVQNRSLATDDLAALNTARDGATADRIQAASRLAAFDAQPDASSDALGYRAISYLRKGRADAASEYAKLAQSAPDGPATKAARAQVETFDAAIKAEENRVRTSLQQTYQAAQAREQALTQRVNGLKQALADLRQRSIQYNIYQRDADTNRELYEALLQRYKEVGVAGAVENNNIAVVDAAKLPDRPSSPRLSVNLALFMLAGALAGAIAAAALDQIDNGVTEPGEFEEKIGMPLLGVAPKLKTESPLKALRNPRSAFVEAYLVILANLELSTAQGAPKSLAVISTRPGEGASTTAIALAQTLARARRKVVLMDANLRSPSIHSAFGLTNGSGLSDLLSGGDDIEAVLRPTGHEGLSAITAGAEPPNPADLLIGERLQQLVKELQDRFDHVIVDCPPALGLADAPLIAAAVQNVVYVVQARSAPTSMVRMALGQLNADRVVGGVLTMFEAKRAHFGHGYPQSRRLLSNLTGAGAP
jgi:capsular exopolysaccharide synthesis family protein